MVIVVRDNSSAVIMLDILSVFTIKYAGTIRFMELSPGSGLTARLGTPTNKRQRVHFSSQQVLP
jgi:hypothetical protein